MDDRPKDFYRPGFDDSKWNSIKAPSNWQMEGFDIPIDVNMMRSPEKCPWGIVDPPRISHDKNPVGSYRMTFVLPGENLIAVEVYATRTALTSRFRTNGA